MTIEEFNNKFTPEQRLGVYAWLLLYFQYFNRSGEGVMGETSPTPSPQTPKTPQTPKKN